MRLVIICIVLASTSALAEPNPPTHRLSLEQDPLAYAVHGWDAIVAYQNGALPHVRATLAVYTADWPITSGRLDDRVKALTVKLQYFPLSTTGRGWMVGTQLALIDKVFTVDMTDGHDEERTFLVAAIAGYRWFPFRGTGFFIYPWARLGVALPVHGDRDLMIGDHKAKAPLFDPLMTFHVGYELTF